MTRAEKIEIAVIAALAAASWFAWPQSLNPLPWWKIVLGLSALLLAQGLIRDIAILLRRRSHASISKTMQCFCLESTVGAGGVIAGIVLAGFAGTNQVTVTRWTFLFTVTATLAIGFLIKDLVITWNPIGLRREKNHLNILVRWKSE